MNDPLSWTEAQTEAWIGKDVSSRLDDLRELQEAAFAVKPGVFNKRKWMEASRRFTRLVLLEIRANARTSAEACRAAVEAGRVDSEAKAMLDQHGAEFFETLVAVAFSRMEDAFEQHDWTGTGVSSPEQATRLMFVGERVEQVVTRGIQADGITKKFAPGLKGFVTRQLEIAFATPGGRPLPTS